MDTIFEWDPVKASSNLLKHGVSFENAVRAFADPNALIEQDRVVDGEARWQLTGRLEGSTLLLVAHAVREEEDLEIIRIVSARLADRKERRVYENANGPL